MLGAPGRLRSTSCRGRARRSPGVTHVQLIKQDHIQQRLVNLDAPVVYDETELAKSIHEEADAGAGGADHLRQSLLRDLGNVLFRLARLAEFRHQQQDPRQTFFARVEKLIDQVGLNAHAALQQELQKEV